jgi:hypothetical protein
VLGLIVQRLEVRSACCQYRGLHHTAHQKAPLLLQLLIFLDELVDLPAVRAAPPRRNLLVRKSLQRFWQGDVQHALARTLSSFNKPPSVRPNPP